VAAAQQGASGGFDVSYERACYTGTATTITAVVVGVFLVVRILPN
jgi:hypothetical protein